MTARDRARMVAREIVDQHQLRLGRWSIKDANEWLTAAIAEAFLLFAQEAAEEEREACAKVAETETLTGDVPPEMHLVSPVDAVIGAVAATAKSIAAAIRGRSTGEAE